MVHPRCAGIDCSKKDAKVCVRIRGQGRRAKSATVTTWGAVTSQILALRQHLVAAKVTRVVIESTSDYWNPFYHLLDEELDVILVNAAAVRNPVRDSSTDARPGGCPGVGRRGQTTLGSRRPPQTRRALRERMAQLSVGLRGSPGHVGHLIHPSEDMTTAQRDVAIGTQRYSEAKKQYEQERRAGGCAFGMTSLTTPLKPRTANSGRR